MGSSGLLRFFSFHKETLIHSTRVLEIFFQEYFSGYSSVVIEIIIR